MPPTPSLQQVTDAGASTTNTIRTTAVELGGNPSLPGVMFGPTVDMPVAPQFGGGTVSKIDGDPLAFSHVLVRHPADASKWLALRLEEYNPGQCEVFAFDPTKDGEAWENIAGFLMRYVQLGHRGTGVKIVTTDQAPDNDPMWFEHPDRLPVYGVMSTGAIAIMTNVSAVGVGVYVRTVSGWLRLAFAAELPPPSP
jgi:hypothetical protein